MNVLLVGLQGGAYAFVDHEGRLTEVLAPFAPTMNRKKRSLVPSLVLQIELLNSSFMLIYKKNNISKINANMPLYI